MPYVVRSMVTSGAGAFKDMAAVKAMGAGFLSGTAYGEILKATPEQIENLAAMVCQKGTILIAETAARCEIVGMLALVDCLHPLTQRRYGLELAWWVDPDHRQHGAGELMLHKAEGWARQNGLYMLQMVAPANSGIGYFYIRQGYKAVETAYQKDLE